MKVLSAILLFLMSIGIRPCCAAGVVGNASDPAALFGEIMTAYQQNALHPKLPNLIKVRPGRYVLAKSAPNDGGVFWNFSGQNALHRCTLDLTGVTLITQDPFRGNVQFTGCTDLTFRGATIYEELPSFTQGTILAVGIEDAAHWYMNVQLDAGYLYQRTDIRDNPTLHIFDGATKDKQGKSPWKTGVGYQHPDSLTEIAGGMGKYHVVLGGVSVPTGLVPQDRVAIRGKGPFSFIVKDCKNATFQNLTLGNNGLYGIVEFDGSGNVYDHVRITYGPAPPGATESPLVSTSADGFHSLYGDPGPTLLNCLIEGTPDDCIAIHGAYFTISQVLPGNVVMIKGNPRFDPGDDMRIQSGTSGFYADVRIMGAQQTAVGWQYTLTDATGVQPGDQAANPRLCGHGYKIIGTTVRRNRARGMLLKADDGLVKNNVAEDCTIAGIVVSPEAGGGEAGYAHNVTIVGNVIRHTGYAETWSGSNQAGALTVTGNGSMGNRNIIIKDNTFETIAGANLEIQDTDGAVITGNRFIQAHRSDTDNGSRAGIDPHALISIGSSRNVTLSDNTADGNGPFGHAPISIAPDTANVQGAENGVAVPPKPSQTKETESQ